MEPIINEYLLFNLMLAVDSHAITMLSYRNALTLGSLPSDYKPDGDDIALSEYPLLQRLSTKCDESIKNLKRSFQQSSVADNNIADIMKLVDDYVELFGLYLTYLKLYEQDLSSSIVQKTAIQKNRYEK